MVFNFNQPVGYDIERDENGDMSKVVVVNGKSEEVEE